MSKVNNDKANIQGMVDSNSRYMRRHAEEKSIVPVTSRMQQNFRTFQIIKMSKNRKYK